MGARTCVGPMEGPQYRTPLRCTSTWAPLQGLSGTHRPFPPPVREPLPSADPGPVLGRGAKGTRSMGREPSPSELVCTPTRYRMTPLRAGGHQRGT